MNSVHWAYVHTQCQGFFNWCSQVTRAFYSHARMLKNAISKHEKSTVLCKSITMMRKFISTSETHTYTTCISAMQLGHIHFLEEFSEHFLSKMQVTISWCWLPQSLEITQMLGEWPVIVFRNTLAIIWTLANSGFQSISEKKGVRNASLSWMQWCAFHSEFIAFVVYFVVRYYFCKVFEFCATDSFSWI